MPVIDSFFFAWISRTLIPSVFFYFFRGKQTTSELHYVFFPFLQQKKSTKKFKKFKKIQKKSKKKKKKKKKKKTPPNYYYHIIKILSTKWEIKKKKGMWERNITKNKKDSLGIDRILILHWYFAAEIPAA